MASVADTALNHHSLTHSITITITITLGIFNLLQLHITYYYYPIPSVYVINHTFMVVPCPRPGASPGVAAVVGAGAGGSAA